jgi:hypothetical protein
MDPIRPIGPVERDLEPVVWVTRSSPDGERERRDQPQRKPRPRPPAPTAASPELPTRDEPDGPSLIDVKV